MYLALKLIYWNPKGRLALLSGFALEVSKTSKPDDEVNFSELIS